MTRSFKVTISITKKPYDRPVHFKVDGGRFDSDKTVKFNINSKYILDFTFRPPQVLESIAGLCLRVLNSGLVVHGTKLPVEELQRSEESIVYRTDWVTTGLSKSVKGTRQKLQIQMQIKNAGELKAELQCKFYGEHEVQHVCWGSALTFLEYECKASENSLFVDVIKETFR